MVNEAIQHHSPNVAKHVYPVLLDASKTVDIVYLYTLFTMLQDKNVHAPYTLIHNLLLEFRHMVLVYTLV